MFLLYLVTLTLKNVPLAILIIINSENGYMPFLSCECEADFTPSLETFCTFADQCITLCIYSAYGDELKLEIKRGLPVR